MKSIIDPDIIIFAYFNDEPIGFFITVPDLNRLIGKFNGKFGWWQKLRLMWDLKVRRSCDRIFGIIFGITPEFHGKGVESGIMTKFWHFLEESQSRYKTMELAWIGDFNPVMNRMIQTYVCASLHKVHTTYRYLFDRDKGVPPLSAAGCQTQGVNTKKHITAMKTTAFHQVSRRGRREDGRIRGIQHAHRIHEHQRRTPRRASAARASST